MLAGLPASLRAARPSAPDLLPDTTVVFATLVDVPEAADRFLNTALGRMGQDPQVRPIIDQVYRQMAEAVAQNQGKIGIGLSDLLSIPQGEAAFAVVAPADRVPAFVFLLDAGKNLTALEVLLKRLDQAAAGGGKRSEELVGGTKIVQFQGVGPARRPLCYFVKETTLVAATDIEVVKQVLVQWEQGSGASLAANPRFSSLMGYSGTAQGAPQLALFVDPIELMRAIGREQTSVQLAVAVLPVLGLDGLTAVGGTVTLDAGDFDYLTELHVLLDQKRAGVLKAVAPGSGDTTPEAWVPAEVSSYMTLHWRFDASLKAAEEVWDGFRGKGSMQDWWANEFNKNAGVDFHQEVLPLLSGRVTLAQRLDPIRRRMPVEQLYGLELKADASAERLLEKIYQKHEKGLEKVSAPGVFYYREKSNDSASAGADQPARPRQCFGQLDQSIVVTNYESFFQKAIEALNSSGSGLAAALDFKLVSSKAGRLPGGRRPALLRFGRPEQSLRLVYERAAELQALPGDVVRGGMGRSVYTALDQNPLPPFEVISRYLAPSGGVLYEDGSGLHYTAFSLKRK